MSAEVHDLRIRLRETQKELYLQRQRAQKWREKALRLQRYKNEAYRQKLRAETWKLRALAKR